MNIDAYNLIIDTIKPLLDGKGFKTVDGEDESYFLSKTEAIRVIYNDGNSTFSLEQSAVSDGNPQEWKSISSWLFDDSSKIQEAKSIANDFEDTLRGTLGMKKTVQRQNGFQLPDKGSAGDAPTVKVLTGRFFTVFPQFKSSYEEYVTENGTFLFVNFYEDIAAPHLQELLRQNDKKRLQKYFDILNETYCAGDNEVRAVVSTCVLAKALKGEKELFERALEYMKDMPYLSLAAQNSVAIR